MQERNGKSWLERTLSVFSEVREGEGATALLMTVNVFLILTAYLIAKVVREPLILAGGGAEIKSYTAAGQVVLLVPFLRVYAFLVSKFPRRQLINYVTIFFVGCLALFYALAQAGMPIGVIFFIWVGIFSLTIIAQFWSFANDIYTIEEGKRLFVIVAFGASAGGVFGPLIAGALIEPLGIYQLLLVSAGILFLSLLITNYVDVREKERIAKVAAVKQTPTSEEEIGKEGAFKVVFQNKYLLMIAFLIMLTNWVNTTGGYILDRNVAETAESLASAADFIGKFYAGFYTVVGAAGLILQLFFVSRIIKYLGVPVAICFLPAIAMGAYVLIALFPGMIALIRWAKTAENSIDYSLNNTVRHILFLPTTREEKYKAKVAIDSFFHRAGDVLSAGLVFVGVTWLSFSISNFAVANLALVAVWLFLALQIGRENKRLVEQQEKLKAEELAAETA